MTPLDTRQERLLRLVYRAQKEKFEKYFCVDQIEWMVFRELRPRGLLTSNGNSVFMEITPKGILYVEDPSFLLVEDVMES